MQRMLTDSAFYEEFLATEDDLVDQYVSGTLTDEERRQFEVTFQRQQRSSAKRFSLDKLFDTILTLFQTPSRNQQPLRTRL
jgi:hypothetical protein